MLLPRGNSGIKFLSDYDELLKALLIRSDDFTMPPNASNQVEIGFTLRSISFDQMSHALIVRARMQYHYTDPRLRWKPKDYKGIEKIRILPNKIWTPDIAVYNEQSSLSYGNPGHPFSAHRAIIRYTGEIEWAPAVVHRASCREDYRNWPYDVHTCELNIGSWSHDNTSLNLTSLHLTPWGDVVIRSDYYYDQFSLAWTISCDAGDKDSIKKNEKFFDIMNYRMRIRRTESHHTASLLIPITCVCWLTFFLPVLKPGTTAKYIGIFINIATTVKLTFGHSIVNYWSGTNTPRIFNLTTQLLILQVLILILDPFFARPFGIDYFCKHRPPSNESLPEEERELHQDDSQDTVTANPSRKAELALIILRITLGIVVAVVLIVGYFAYWPSQNYIYSMQHYIHC